jgi:hypothetical protein
MKLFHFLVALLFAQGVLSNIIGRWDDDREHEDDDHRCPKPQLMCQDRCRDVKKDNNFCGNCHTTVRALLGISSHLNVA